MFQTVIFYKYTFIENPLEFQKEQRKLCEKLNLKGRLIVASEGINGTLEGLSADLQAYYQDLTSKQGFEDINFKYSYTDGSSFPKLSVKVRDEIVSLQLGEEDFSPLEITGKYLEAEELHSWFEKGEEFYIVDMRNDYEHVSGHFENAVLPKLKNFRDLPQVLSDLIPLQDKKVVTVCTGGIRCEKASGFLVKNGFQDVYQLKDGIVTYMEKYPNQHFKGKLYVFDQRILMGFNTDSPEHEIIGKCEYCQEASENYINCSFNHCNRHYILCEACQNSELNFCSQECAADYQEQKESIGIKVNL